MDATDIKKLAETIEAGLRDGRSLESLKTAMQESGYNDEKIKEIISNVDRKNTIRRPARPNSNDRSWVAASVVILVILISFSFLLFAPKEEIKEQSTGRDIVTETTTEQGEKICYVVNETIKSTMVDAGVYCDKWILIREI